MKNKKQPDLWEEFSPKGPEPTFREKLEEAVLGAALPLLLQLDKWGGMDRENQTTTCIGIIAFMVSFIGIALLINNGFKYSLSIFLLIIVYPISWMIVRAYWDVGNELAKLKKREARKNG